MYAGRIGRRTSTISDLQHFRLHVELSSNCRGVFDAGLDFRPGRLDWVGGVQIVQESPLVFADDYPSITRSAQGR